MWLLFFLEGVANFCHGVANFRHGVAKNPDALCGVASGRVFGCRLGDFFFHFCDFFRQKFAGSIEVPTFAAVMC